MTVNNVETMIMKFEIEKKNSETNEWNQNEFKFNWNFQILIERNFNECQNDDFFSKTTTIRKWILIVDLKNEKCNFEWFRIWNDKMISMIIIYHVTNIIEFIVIDVISNSIMRSIRSIDAILKTIVMISKFQNIVHFSFEIFVDYNRIEWFVDLIFEKITKIFAKKSTIKHIINSHFFK